MKTNKCFVNKRRITKNLQKENPDSSKLEAKEDQCIGPTNMIISKFIENYNKPVNTPYVIGICGASGSGKSFIAEVIYKTIRTMFPESSRKETVIISQDSYYIGGDADTNYDIPISIDFDLLISHLQKLINGESIECPVYDFVTHSRTKKTKTIHPVKIIIVEGILILTQPELRDLFNTKIFIDADVPTQIFRRAERDQNERGRSLKDIRLRYERDVWPSYQEHVLPSSKYADITINNFNDCYVGPQIVLSHIINILSNICDK